MALKALHRFGLLLALASLLAATRFSHFGTAAWLPDASLAVFLLGGLLLRRACGFTVLMLAAFGADVLSAQTAEQAGWCLTPAYWGLIPTYATLWLAGAWLGYSRKLDLLHAAGIGFAAIAAAFVISNATWFAFSNTVEATTAGEYALAVLKYFPPYLASAMLYLVPVWLGWKLTQAGAVRRT